MKGKIRLKVYLYFIQLEFLKKAGKILIDRVKKTIFSCSVFFLSVINYNLSISEKRMFRILCLYKNMHYFIYKVLLNDLVDNFFIKT